MAQLSAKDVHITRWLLAFLVFLIITSPALAGEQGHAFFTFLGHAFSQFRIFLEGLLGQPTS